MQDFILRLCYSLPGFLLAICLHEYSHALVATKFGDPTAREAGRLTMNPISHFDIFGTIILPLVLIAQNWGVFGYAKPVPIDARHFKNVRKAVFWVSFAGPIANLVLVVLSAFFLVLFVNFVPKDFYLFLPIAQMLRFSVDINVLFAVFNLIPFPPLDGSRMVSTFLNYNQSRVYESWERYSFLFFMALWITNGFSYILAPAMMLGDGVVNMFALMLS